MNIKPFAVEEWMNEYEAGALYNIAETCVDSVSLDELFELTGENKEDFLKDYQKQRLIAPYDPSIDPDGWGITWQTTQSKMTLASGRLTGVEEGHTPSVFTGKHTDFIFSCVGENLGMIGCIVVILLLMILIIHCVRIGLKSGRTFDMLVCIGVAAAVTFQTFINIGMNIGITPVIGITLPFFSYGGSSMVTMFAAMGLVSGIKYKLKPEHFSLIY